MQPHSSIQSPVRAVESVSGPAVETQLVDEFSQQTIQETLALAKAHAISNPTLNQGGLGNADAAMQMSPFSKQNLPQTQQIVLSHPAEVKKLPQGLLADIKQFKIEGFAKKFFTEHRKGLFRQRVPIEKMLIFTKVYSLTRAQSMHRC
jgi:hypothetical protein